MKKNFIIILLVCSLTNVLQATERRNVFPNMNMSTEFSPLLQEKIANRDSLLPSLNVDKAFADEIRRDSAFWSLGSAFEKKETIATKLNVKVVFIDGVREEPFCTMDSSLKSHAGEWNVRIGIDVVSGGSNIAHAHVQQCLDKVRDELGYAVRNGEKIVFIPPNSFLAKNEDNNLVGDSVDKKPQDTALENKEQEQLRKHFWGGAFAAVTYNDFYGTEFGLTGLKSTKEYNLKTENADDLLGNYWGIGFNLGFGGIYMFTPRWAVNADLGFAFRRGSGESKFTVELDWKDESQKSEESDLSIEYSERQFNIDIPITLRFMVPDLMYVEAGPLMSFNVYSKNKSTITDVYGSKTYRDSDGLNVFEFGLVFGSGMMRHVGNGIIDLNLRFLLGITPLCDAPDSPKTWQGQFNIAYWFI